MNQLTTFWNNFWNNLGSWFPLLLGAIVVLLIGWFIAGVLEAGTKALLARFKVNDRVYSSHGGDRIAHFIPNIEHLIGSIVFWLIMIAAISLAVSVLGIPALTAFIFAIYAYLPNVIAALLIFLIASAITAALDGMINRVMGDTPTGKLLEVLIPFIVLGIAVFMILDQLKIAPAIVNITYTALMGSVALGLALAFGLGGRDVASRILDAAYQKGLESAKQVKQDVNVAKKRGANEVKKAQNNLNSKR